MIGFISDAHGNRPAFDLAIHILKRNGVDKFVFLGDSVGYLPTSSVLCAIQDLSGDISCITGNHEDILLSNVFDQNLEKVFQHEATSNLINTDQLYLLKTWPDHIVLEFTAGNVLCIHGSPNDFIYGYVFSDTELATFSVEQDFVFMGHTHRPFIKEFDGKTFVNVGSCGLPRDHGSLGSAVIFDNQTGRIRIIRFDIEEITKNWLKNFDYIHPCIYELLGRKTQKYEGCLIHE